MPELHDLSGSYNPDLKFGDLSKEFLLKLLDEWQLQYKVLSDGLFEALMKRVSIDECINIMVEAGTKMWETVMPRYAKLANVPLNTVVDSLKFGQLPVDGTTGRLYPFTDEIISPNHAIRTVHQCANLEQFEKYSPELIEPICSVLEPKAMALFLLNPKIKVTPLKLPPRKSPDEIACVWDFRIEE